jgi:hypothetical protein
MKPFLSFQGSRACFFTDLFTGDPCPLRIPFDRPFDSTQGHEQRRMAQGCGFPHSQVAKRTAPSDSAAFDKPLGHELEAEWLRPRASRGELVAGRQSLKKQFHGLAGQENSRQERNPWPLYGSGYGAKAIINIQYIAELLLKNTLCSIFSLHVS